MKDIQKIVFSKVAKKGGKCTDEEKLEFII
jgi:hypothetical protein